VYKKISIGIGQFSKYILIFQIISVKDSTRIN